MTQENKTRSEAGKTTEGAESAEKSGAIVAYEWTEHGVIGIDAERGIKHILVNEEALLQALLEGAQAKAEVAALKAEHDKFKRRALSAEAEYFSLKRHAEQIEEALRTPVKVTGATSDGYHTFDELYEHRHALMLAVMLVEFPSAWFSRKHADGTSMDGWFIAGVDLPAGTITYHLPERLWDAAMCSGAVLLSQGKPWDGHTSNDMVSRLLKFAKHGKEAAK